MTTTKVVPGILIAAPDADSVAHEASVRIARGLCDAIEERGKATIALSGGNTPRAAYGLLAGDASVNWAKVEVFWVDERAVPPTDDRSNFKHAKEKLLEPAKVRPEQIHRMPGEAADLAAAAREYEQLLRTRVQGVRGMPMLDVMVLGVGDDGHTASLFPGEPEVEITDRLVAHVPAKAGREARLTMTAPVIELARSVIVLAVGKAKNAPLERVWNVAGSVRDTPARIIRDAHGAITWIIDRAAGGITG
jgi:6-phosphogluconolactonase